MKYSLKLKNCIYKELNEQHFLVLTYIFTGCFHFRFFCLVYRHLTFIYFEMEVTFTSVELLSEKFCYLLM